MYFKWFSRKQFVNIILSQNLKLQSSNHMRITKENILLLKMMYMDTCTCFVVGSLILFFENFKFQFWFSTVQFGYTERKWRQIVHFQQKWHENCWVNIHYMFTFFLKGSEIASSDKKNIKKRNKSRHSNLYVKHHM